MSSVLARDLTALLVHASDVATQLPCFTDVADVARTVGFDLAAEVKTLRDQIAAGFAVLGPLTASEQQLRTEYAESLRDAAAGRQWMGALRRQLQLSVLVRGDGARAAAQDLRGALCSHAPRFRGVLDDLRRVTALLAIHGAALEDGQGLRAIVVLGERMLERMSARERRIAEQAEEVRVLTREAAQARVGLARRVDRLRAIWEVVGGVAGQKVAWPFGRRTVRRRGAKGSDRVAAS